MPSTNPNVSQQDAEEIVRFVSWAVTEGQQYADRLAYVPLPQSVIDHNLETLRSLSYKDTSLEAVVVPEFGMIAALVLVASIVGVIGYTKLSAKMPT